MNGDGERVRKPLGPSYDEEGYWNDKFTKNVDSFEWLGSGRVLLEAFEEFIAEWKRGGSKVREDACGNDNADTCTLPTVLQLGAGTSLLSLEIAQLHYPTTPESLSSIINVDFSQVALDYGREQACKAHLDGMQYVRVDLRDWLQVKQTFILEGNPPIDFIFDKSTSDAISTNEDILYDLSEEAAVDRSSRTCPLLLESLKKKRRGRKNDGKAAHEPHISLDPLDLVAVHLAALSRPGCLWAVLSYSSSRFDFLLDTPSQGNKDGNFSLSKQYWSVRKQESILQAPSGNNADPCAPAIFHWFYLLERTDCLS